MKMKIKRPKFFFAVMLTLILIALLVILALFVNQLSQSIRTGASPSPSESTPTIQKKIVYISNNLEDRDEYDQVTKLRNYFEPNENLQFQILDSYGLLPQQTKHIDSLQSLPVDLIIINPIDAQNIYDKLSGSNIPVIYLNVQPTKESGVSIYFSDESGARLIAQHVFASVYPDSNICIVAKEKSNSLYQKTLEELKKVKNAYSAGQAIVSYFTYGIEISDIKRAMPDLMNSQAVVILDPANTSSIVQYLESNEFTGYTIAVSQDEKMTSKLMEGKLDAIVYRDKELFAKTVYKTALDLLNGSNFSTSIDCHQELLKSKD
jgi:ABC-type sugar transport system substrate-binding protein